MSTHGRLGAHLAFVMFIGAARSDADEQQTSLLRERVLPLLDTFKADGNARPVLDAVLEVMGPDWQPRGEWSDYIDSLLRKDGGTL